MVFRSYLKVNAFLSAYFNSSALLINNVYSNLLYCLLFLIDDCILSCFQLLNMLLVAQERRGLTFCFGCVIYFIFCLSNLSLVFRKIKVYNPAKNP